MVKPLIIGIAGGTASGKTTFVRAVAGNLNPKDIIIVQHDSYYKDNSQLSFQESEYKFQSSLILDSRDQ